MQFLLDWGIGLVVFGTDCPRRVKSCILGYCSTSRYTHRRLSLLLLLLIHVLLLSQGLAWNQLWITKIFTYIMRVVLLLVCLLLLQKLLKEK